MKNSCLLEPELCHYMSMKWLDLVKLFRILNGMNWLRKRSYNYNSYVNSYVSCPLNEYKQSLCKWNQWLKNILITKFSSTFLWSINVIQQRATKWINLWWSGSKCSTFLSSHKKQNGSIYHIVTFLSEKLLSLLKETEDFWQNKLKENTTDLEDKWVLI